MINKLYDGILNYIKYNYGFLITLILLLVAFNINTGYVIYKPGGSINVSERIISDNKISESSGSFNMAYVGMIDGKLPFYLFSKIFPSWDLVKSESVTYGDNETIKDSLKREHVYLEESISNAKYLAYTKSDTNFEIIKKLSYIIYVSEKCTGDVKIGDEILKYDGIAYNSLDDLKAYISSKDEGEEIEFLLKRDGKEIVSNSKVYIESETKLIGLIAVTTLELDSDVNISIDSKASESGPSGGLMLTLAIYDALINEDITKGLKIVGTGTIDLDGAVGEIGGVTYKLAGAVKKNADVFIVPMKNYEEARIYAKEKNYDIMILGVASFDEALEALENLEVKK